MYTLLYFYQDDNARTTSRQLVIRLKQVHFERNRERIHDATADMDFVVKDIDTIIGKGVFACTSYEPGDELLAYHGTRLDYNDGLEAETSYNQSTHHSYLLSYRWEGKNYWIDATDEKTKGKGRLVNHSYLHPNARVVPVKYKNKALIVIRAIRHINKGDEIRYDYNELRKDVIKDNPWLKNS